MSALHLESSAFSNGDEIPRKYGYKNGNTSPPLTISGVPPNCQSLVLIMDDPDAKAAVGKVWVHWVVWNILPDVLAIKESSLPANCQEGLTDFGEVGYGGPAPPDKKHTYIFKLYALDSKLDISSGSDKNQVEDAIKNHILEETTLTGTYEP
jgi:Raf kinase inhibitor-like YbhB/YbcL family protein